MRYLLTPITGLVNYLAAYFACWLLFIAITYILNWYWLLLFFFYFVILGVISFLINVPLSLIQLYFAKFFNYKLFPLLVNLFAGLVGLGHFFVAIKQMPVEAVSTSVTNYFSWSGFLSELWNNSWYLAFFFVVAFLILIVQMFYILLGPVLTKYGEA